MVRVYGVGGKLLKEVQNFQVNSRAGVRMGNDIREWFTVNVGLRQGSVMSPWLLNIYIYIYTYIYGWCGSRGEFWGAWQRTGAAEYEWWLV